jgi:hypothetical protein
VVTAGESQLPSLVTERVFQALRFRCEYPGGMLQARVNPFLTLALMGCFYLMTVSGNSS